MKRIRKEFGKKYKQVSILAFIVIMINFTAFLIHRIAIEMSNKSMVSFICYINGSVSEKGVGFNFESTGNNEWSITDSRSLNDITIKGDCYFDKLN